jgi:hypothetical protein
LQDSLIKIGTNYGYGFTWYQLCAETNPTLCQRTVNEVRKQHTHDVHERMSLQGENKVIHGVNTSWDKTGLPAVSEEIVSWLINAFRIDNWPQRMCGFS